MRVDEVPQLWNVLRGDMALVGPRPERVKSVEWLSQEIPYYYVRHIICPGITGWAQVCYHYGASLEDSKEKLKYDLYYIKNMSLGLDLAIILKSIKIVVLGRGRDEMGVLGFIPVHPVYLCGLSRLALSSYPLNPFACVALPSFRPFLLSWRSTTNHKPSPVNCCNLSEADYPADHYEIVVVSDGSTDATNELLAGWPKGGCASLYLPNTRVRHQHSIGASARLRAKSSSSRMPGKRSSRMPSGIWYPILPILQWAV